MPMSASLVSRAWSEMPLALMRGSREVRDLVAEERQRDPAAVYGESSGTTALPSSALTIGAPSVSATCSSSSPAPKRPLFGEDHRLLAAVERRRGALERLRVRDDDRRGPGLGRVPLDVL